MDPDRLVLLALSEEVEEPTEIDHLEHCAGCRHEIQALRDVAEIGAETGAIRDLPAPPEHVWQAIRADVAATRAPVTGLTRHRVRRARPRWLAPVLAAAAAAVIAAAGTVGFDRFADRAPVLARATLAPLETVPPNAGGAVQVFSDGRLRIDVQNLPLTSGFHEVWLLDPDTPGKMVAVGNLPGRAEAVLTVPAGTDLNRYRLVDISDEPHDGDATHSGKSLLRGTLTK
ncbi:anti-sigma factor [Actinoplanes couchii]|uniref:anti-sigma factor n=1 Tax=Actinoplanes couchii TaxID=403638 RepID=UPI001EF17D26|nr:anti-sigma factor [Actinoplanes couchii]MDR6316062.1 anti-sigma-K factor RskA [Actinoplanes couchii]